jgi:hypothetical protein
MAYDYDREGNVAAKVEESMPKLYELENNSVVISVVDKRCTTIIGSNCCLR